MTLTDPAAVRRVQEYGDRVARLLAPLDHTERCSVLAAMLGIALCDMTWPATPRFVPVMLAIRENADLRAARWRQQRESCEGKA